MRPQVRPARRRKRQDTADRARQLGPGYRAPRLERVVGERLDHARTRNGWSDQPIPEAVLRELYDLVKFGPTAANTTPARFVFVIDHEDERSPLCHRV